MMVERSTQFLRILLSAAAGRAEMISDDTRASAMRNKLFWFQSMNFNLSFFAIAALQLLLRDESEIFVWSSIKISVFCMIKFSKPQANFYKRR